MLNQFKRRHRILMLISGILVLAATWILSLNKTNDVNAGWNADMWITNSFWEQNPSDGNIIAALFGNGTPGSSPYNRYWDGFCLPNKVRYVHNVAQIQNMVRDTVYVIEDGFYYLDNDIIPASCSAIIGKGTGEVIFSGAGIDISAKYNVIIDNLIFEGDNIELINANYSTLNNVETKNIGIGVSLNNSKYNRLNRVKSHDNTYGIIDNGGEHNFISECELFNDDHGLFMKSAENNIINNCQIYNNNVGVRIDNRRHNSINNCQIYNNDVGVYINNSEKNVINNSNIYSNTKGIELAGNNENLLMSGNIYNNSLGISLSNGRIRYYNTIGLFGNGINYDIPSKLIVGGYEDEGNYSSTTDLLVLLRPSLGKFKTDLVMDRFFRTYPVDLNGIKFITPLSEFRKGNLDWMPTLPIKYIAGKKIIKQVRPVGFSVTNKNSWGVLLHEHNPDYFIASIDSETSELDDSIINYYYGDYNNESEFSKNWNEKNCNINVMTVEYISDQTGFYDRLLYGHMPLGHTIYVLADGNYDVTDSLVIENDCTAIVNYKGSNANLKYYPGDGSFYPMIHVDGHENIVFDGLALDGNSSSNDNILLDRFDSIASQNSTLNNIQSYNSLGNGIQLGMLSNYNTIMNTQVWNNQKYGIELFLAGENNIINNSIVYNNEGYGLRFGNKSKHNSINNSQFFNNNEGGIFSDLNTESNIINNVHIYNNNGLGINFKWSSGNVLNNLYSYNNLIGINIEDDSAINNIYISDIYVFENKEANLNGTNGDDIYLRSDYIFITGVNSETPISHAHENIVEEENDSNDVNLVADLSNGIGVDDNTDNNGGTLKSSESGSESEEGETDTNLEELDDEESRDIYKSILRIFSGTYYKLSDSAWTEKYAENCSGKITTFMDTDFAFGEPLCDIGATGYVQDNITIAEVKIKNIDMDYECEYKITGDLEISFESNMDLTGISISIGDTVITNGSWQKTGGFVVSGNTIISSGNYIYSSHFDHQLNGLSGALYINFSYGDSTGLAELDGFNISFVDSIVSEDDIYIDLRKDYGFEVKNKGIYLQDSSIFVLRDTNITTKYPIYIGKCSAIIGDNNSVIQAEYTGQNIINFTTGSQFSVADHISFNLTDGEENKVFGFTHALRDFYTIINTNKVNSEKLLGLDSNMSYASQAPLLQYYIKFLPISGDNISGTKKPEDDIVWYIVTGLTMSCQYATNVQNNGLVNNWFFQNNLCDNIGVIYSWSPSIENGNIKYIFGGGISKQIAPVGYINMSMVGLDNQYIDTSFIGETNPILYTDPGTILFSGAFVYGVDTGTNYEINVNFTNQNVINHNFDVLLNINEPDDIEGHLEVKIAGTWEDIGTGTENIDYKSFEALRIVVKTPDKYLQEIDGTLYIGTEEYGNNSEVFWIQTIADPTPPTIVRLKSINKGGTWEDGDNIWQIKTDGKYTVKAWYDYVNSPDDCNSGITMNEYNDLSEMNLKSYMPSASVLDGKYVCIFAKDIVSNKYTTAVSNQIKISSVNIVDDIIPGPSYYDSVSVSFANTYNYGYTWVVNQGRCNTQNTEGIRWINYDGSFILNSDRYNNRYMCIKAEDSLGNVKYFTSAHSVNIVGRGDMVYFIDGINPSWNNKDTISVGFSNNVEFVEKSYKWVSNILECTNTGGMVPYTKPIVVDTKYLNGYYFCMYTLESGSNIENYLISPTPLKVDNIPPTAPTIVSPIGDEPIYYLAISLEGASDSDAGLAGYEYQISKDTTFMEIYDNGFSLASGNTFVPKFDGEAGTYAIRVRSVDNAGNVSNTWDNTPYVQFMYQTFSGFTFDDITGAELGKKYSSTTITIQGLGESGSTYVEVTNGVLYRNGVAKGTGSIVEDNDTISIRMSSSDKYNTKVVSNLIILNKVIPWTIITKEQDPISEKYGISDEDKEDVKKIFDNMVKMYADEGERMEMFYTMKSLLKDEIALGDGDTGRLKYMLTLIEEYLDDSGENGGKIHTAPNCKKYEISYNEKNDGYYSPNMMVINGKVSYFATVTDLLRFIDSKNGGGECGYHIYKKITKHTSTSSTTRHIAPNGKIYNIEYTKLGYTSTDLSTTKYFASVYDLKSYINTNNPAVNLLSWDHTVDVDFTPETYTAPNGKSYVIYHTDKGYMSYKFMSVKYFNSLDEMEAYIDKNNKK